VEIILNVFNRSLKFGSSSQDATLSFEAFGTMIASQHVGKAVCIVIRPLKRPLAVCSAQARLACTVFPKREIGDCS
jgi:hypothetical protein